MEDYLQASSQTGKDRKTSTRSPTGVERDVVYCANGLPVAIAASGLPKVEVGLFRILALAEVGIVETDSRQAAEASSPEIGEETDSHSGDYRQSKRENHGSGRRRKRLRCR